MNRNVAPTSTIGSGIISNPNNEETEINWESVFRLFQDEKVAVNDEGLGGIPDSSRVQLQRGVEHDATWSLEEKGSANNVAGCNEFMTKQSNEGGYYGYIESQAGHSQVKEEVRTFDTQVQAPRTGMAQIYPAALSGPYLWETSHNTSMQHSRTWPSTPSAIPSTPMSDTEFFAQFSASFQRSRSGNNALLDLTVGNTLRQVSAPLEQVQQREPQHSIGEPFALPSHDYETLWQNEAMESLADPAGRVPLPRNRSVDASKRLPIRPGRTGMESSFGRRHTFQSTDALNRHGLVSTTPEYGNAMMHAPFTSSSHPIDHLDATTSDHWTPMQAITPFHTSTSSPKMWNWSTSPAINALNSTPIGSGSGATTADEEDKRIRNTQACESSFLSIS